MANRRKFIAGLGALATGSAAAVGTGAFTSVEANRGINVDVAGDASAFLALEPTNDPNSDYVIQESDGTISLQFDGSHANNTAGLSESNVNGLNEDAFTQIGKLFNITNQGTKDIIVWMEQDPDGDSTQEIGPGTGIDFAAGSANKYVSGTGLTDTQQNGDGAPVPRDSFNRIDVGNSMEDVGAIFGGYLGDISDLDVNLKIVAKAVTSFDKYNSADDLTANDEKPSDVAEYNRTDAW